MEMKECHSLEEVREEIDLLDTQIVRLIAKRNAYIHQAARFKVSVDEVKAEDRVADVIARVREEALRHNLNPNMIQTIYKIMIDEMVESEIAEFRNAKNL